MICRTCNKEIPCADVPMGVAPGVMCNCWHGEVTPQASSASNAQTARMNQHAASVDAQDGGTYLRENTLPLELLPDGWAIDSMGYDGYDNEWFCELRDHASNAQDVNYGRTPRQAMLNAIAAIEGRA